MDPTTTEPDPLPDEIESVAGEVELPPGGPQLPPPDQLDKEGRELLGAMQLAARAGALTECLVVDFRHLMFDSARANAKRGAYLKIAVPDSGVKALRGPAEKASHIYALLAVPRIYLEQLRGAKVLVSPGGKPVGSV